MFNDKIKKLKTEVLVEKSEALTSYDYVPSGTTALRDSIINCCAEINNSKEKYDKIILLIMTDGLDNTSTCSVDLTKTTIENTLKDNKIEISLMAANQNALEIATQLGIPTECAITFTQDDEYISEVMDCTRTCITRAITGETNGLVYTELERNRSCGK